MGREIRWLDIFVLASTTAYLLLARERLAMRAAVAAAVLLTPIVASLFGSLC